MGRYLRVNLLGLVPHLMKKEFTGLRSHKRLETLLYGVHHIANRSQIHY